MTDRNYMMAERIASEAAKKGGRTFYVGGLVRDRLMGRENKDVDIEVHGIDPSVLHEILEKLGKPIAMGASFGVYGLKGYEIDIAMPRKETATGRGHKDFDVFVDPYLGTEKAAIRRDFTINAMMQDVLTGEIVDHFGGQEDLKEGVIRHVNDVTFAEDPLRVLRAAQFAARFKFDVAPETIKLSSTMDLSALACERIMGELQKAFLKSDKPSVFFEVLFKMNQLGYWFPEILTLKGVPQNVQHHPEGDVWNHTMMTLDAAASFRSSASYPLGLMMSALVHDAGKSVATEVKDGEIHAYMHETLGLPLVQKFLDRICNEVKLQRYVLNMTEQHMKPNMYYKDGAARKKYCKMFDESVCPDDLLLLSKADHFGRTDPSPYEEQEAFLRNELEVFKERMAQPFVQGRDLVEAGVRPGPEFHEALLFAHKLRLAGVPKERALSQTLAEFFRDKA
ncbi:MAG: tRNA nucleotidyltransferase [Blautia sp.]|nr:tRNA nucleotidyltransferase [Blautia sp.]